MHMEILYFGTVCSLERYETFLKICKQKPSVATLVFESALLDGLGLNGINVQVNSFPMIPTFPNSRTLYFGGFSEKLSCGYSCRWMKTLNVPVLKQLARKIDARKVMRQWIKETDGDRVILCYSIPPFMTKDIIDFGKKHGVKTVVIVPDLPQNMYQNHKKNRIIYSIKSLYLKAATRNQGGFDGYVYLTEAMSKVVAPDKPYIIVEGILNSHSVSSIEDNTNSRCRSIMYAGQLHEKYGVIQMLDAFEQSNIGDTELWLFGAGTAEHEVIKRAEKNQKIRYFGRVDRFEILKREKQATLLVNLRSTKEDYTKYSFPSKIIEYMYSGTPVLTTRLEGIPNEYFEYVYDVADNEVDMLKDKFEKIFLKSDVELSAKGAVAKQFVEKQKNSKIQSFRIIDFLYRIIKEK